jgi:predicted acetyltransferase
MTINLSNCHIRTPVGDERLAIYRLLMEIFPADRPLIGQIIDDEDRFPDWPCYCLCSGDRVLGNVSLAPMQVWLDGRAVPLVGIAWVATRKEHRRQGIAKRLLRHALEVVDAQGLPAVLFTGLPGVYQPLGFEIVEQVYPAVPAQRLASGRPKLDIQTHGTLTPKLVETIARIDAESDSNQDGRVVRDTKYWQLYGALFNGNPNVGLLVCKQEGRAVGYVRVETEDDRLLVSELSCPTAATDVARALLDCVAELAMESKRNTITLALPSDHPAMRSLRQSGVTLEPEPATARRETFMVRGPSGQAVESLKELQWPLCDKF